MIGPRSSYDSATLAEYDRRVEYNTRKARLIALLKDKDVQKLIRDIVAETKAKGEVRG